jgi:hypothetical protein
VLESPWQGSETIGDDYKSFALLRAAVLVLIVVRSCPIIAAFSKKPSENG